MHAWVHERDDSRVRKALFAGLLAEKYGLEATAETAANFDERFGAFVVDNERDEHVVVALAGRTFALPPTAPNGHASAELELDAGWVSSIARGGRLRFSAVLPSGDERVFAGEVNLVDETGWSVVSDIDDTVKVTEVADRRAMFDRTFFQDFQAAPGMAELYARWARRGATFHFVSSSPWNLYEPLDGFMTSAGFPSRTLSLKLVRVKDETLLDLLRKGTETKPAQIEPILARFPRRRFVLVGDSGEQDPEVYGALATTHPEQIEHVYIRNVDRSARSDDRYRKAFATVAADRWTLFTDPSGLVLPGSDSRIASGIEARRRAASNARRAAAVRQGSRTAK